MKTLKGYDLSDGQEARRLALESLAGNDQSLSVRFELAAILDAADFDEVEFWIAEAESEAARHTEQRKPSDY